MFPQQFGVTENKSFVTFPIKGHILDLPMWTPRQPKPGLASRDEIININAFYQNIIDQKGYDERKTL